MHHIVRAPTQCSVLSECVGQHVVREIPHWFETHGDFGMDPALGYVSQLPKDTCVRLELNS